MTAKYTNRLASVIKKSLVDLRADKAIEANFHALFFHRENLLSALPAVTRIAPVGAEIDGELIRRIVAAYQKANIEDIGESMWRIFFNSYHQQIHQTLINGDERAAAEIFRNPGTSDLFYGFDILTKSYINSFRKKKVRQTYAKLCLDGLVRFAEAVGAIPMDNKETWRASRGDIVDTEEVLKKIDQSLGWVFSVPNPFPNEPGLDTSRGVVSYRVPQALYQAWKIKEHVKGVKNPRILEIGGGLGRTAYYAYGLGLRDYTIVDLPITAASQAYFLGRTLGGDHLHLDKEGTNDSTHQKIKITSPAVFADTAETYDLIVNVDSLTEMDVSVARAYWEKIKHSTKKFLSINHEANSFRVADIIANDLQSVSVERILYWMRHGYVEEIITM